jgi:hypothetical protein
MLEQWEKATGNNDFNSLQHFPGHVDGAGGDLGRPRDPPTKKADKPL